jgi:aerobic-type carbon monoxide dehydrogenase small subunit (CoxS/CutS family)
LKTTTETIAFTLNGQAVTVQADPTTTAVDLIRYACGLTGTKDGCGVGECGACTVLVEGTPALSCLMLAAELVGQNVTTIESTDDDRIGRMREAFLAEAALQCGFCTPGMVLAASRIAEGATADEIRAALVGNLCRCTGYASIVRAVQQAHAGDCDRVGSPGPEELR